MHVDGVWEIIVLYINIMSMCDKNVNSELNENFNVTSSFHLFTSKCFFYCYYYYFVDNLTFRRSRTREQV